MGEARASGIASYFWPSAVVGFAQWFMENLNLGFGQTQHIAKHAKPKGKGTLRSALADRLFMRRLAIRDRE